MSVNSDRIKSAPKNSRTAGIYFVNEKGGNFLPPGIICSTFLFYLYNKLIITSWTLCFQAVPVGLNLKHTLTMRTSCCYIIVLNYVVRLIYILPTINFIWKCRSRIKKFNCLIDKNKDWCNQDNPPTENHRSVQIIEWR